MKRVIELNHNEAKAFFLKEESYFSFDLPQYFIFHKLLEAVENKIVGKLLSDFYDSITTAQGRQKALKPSVKMLTTH